MFVCSTCLVAPKTYSKEAKSSFLLIAENQIRLVLGAWCLVLGAWCLVLGASPGDASVNVPVRPQDQAHRRQIQRQARQACFPRGQAQQSYAQMKPSSFLLDFSPRCVPLAVSYSSNLPYLLEAKFSFLSSTATHATASLHGEDQGLRFTSGSLNGDDHGLRLTSGSLHGDDHGLLLLEHTGMGTDAA